VIGPTGAVRVMVATKPVDFRKGAEGLAALVRETMMADPFSGAVRCAKRQRRCSRVDDLSCGEVNQEPGRSSQSSAEYDLIW
jgi:hypothetical protein